MEQLVTGKYYYFDCMNAFVSNRFFEITAFENEADAIKTAANYEATLILYTLENGETIDCKIIYDPSEF